MKATTKQLRELLKIVSATLDEEIDCDELLARVGDYLEALKKSDQLTPELQAVAQHLVVCAECAEEFEALQALQQDN